METKQAAVVERLKAREAQRTAEVAKRHEELHADDVETESAPAFLEEFGRHRAAFEADIEAYAGLPAGDQPSTLEDLANQAANLERSLASAAYFLPPYDLRNASLAISSLKQRLDAATQAQQPRKKFSFSKKAASTKEINKSQQDGHEKETTPSAQDISSAPGSSILNIAIPTGRTISGKKDEIIILTTSDIKDSEAQLNQLIDEIKKLEITIADYFVEIKKINFLPI